MTKEELIQRRKDDIKKRREERDRKDLKKILAMPEGRRFIWKVLSECGIYRGTFRSDSNLSAHLEGKRDIGLFILNEILKRNLDSFYTMQNEAASLKQSEDDEIRAVAEEADE